VPVVAAERAVLGHLFRLRALRVARRIRQPTPSRPQYRCRRGSRARGGRSRRELRSSAMPSPSASRSKMINPRLLSSTSPLATPSSADARDRREEIDRKPGAV
jgi:hypothetical protein